jgi:hypothetical protein
MRVHMSNETNEEGNKVVINEEDIKNIEDFFNHFRIDIPDFLKSELDTYRSSPDTYGIDNQEKLKAELAHAIVASDHELFKDKLFENVVKNCTKCWFDTQFDRDLESGLSDNEKEEVSGD